MNTNSHGSPIPSKSERKHERKRREKTGLANSVRGGGAPARSPVPERTDDDGRWRAAAAVDRECESESEAASESRRRGGGGMGIRDLGLGMEREAAGSGLYMRRGGLASWAASLAGPNEAVGAPGHHRAMPVPCYGPGWRPRHSLVPRVVPAWARWPPGRAGPKRRSTGQAGGPWATWPTLARTNSSNMGSMNTPILLPGRPGIINDKNTLCH